MQITQNRPPAVPSPGTSVPGAPQQADAGPTSPPQEMPGADKFDRRCEAGKGIPIRICSLAPKPPSPTLPVRPWKGPLLKPWPGIPLKPWLNLPHIFKPLPRLGHHGGVGANVISGCKGIPIRIC